MVKVSVAIPTLNEEDNLPTCLDNLLPQLKSGDEAIVVDGGSDDRTVEIAENAGCDVYVNEGNSSIGTDRNIGANKANNEVIATLDADSLPPKGWLSKVRRHFEDDEELVVLWGNVIDVNGVPIRNLVGKFSTLIRGASGNNTAFRKDAFEKTEGYPDVDFKEDVYMINRLSKVGKAKRDSDLVMVMNMDRKRYQTIPVVVGGGGLVLLSRKLDGKISDVTKGIGAGLVGTEMVYENFSGHGTGLHHDQLGVGIAGASKILGGSNEVIEGIGSGVSLHHALTEGVSAFPSELYKNTDEEK